MTEAPFTGVDGTYVQMPPRNVVPKPVQKPHPPLWVACSRRDTIHLAAQYGIGALTFAFIDPEEAEHWVSDYYSTLENEGVPIGKAVNANIACVTTFMCAPTEEQAIQRGLEGANFFGYSLAHYYVFGEHRPGVTDVWAEYQERRDQHGYSVDAAAIEQERLGAKIAAGDNTGLRGAVGTPEQIREFLMRYEEMGVDQIIFVSQAGKNRHEDIMESLELFGTKVLPEFQERDEKLTADKAKRLEPIIDKVMARKTDDAPPLPSPDYAFPAIPRRMAEASGNKEFQDTLEKIAADRAAGKRDARAGILG
jgi:alkanesulfonate monooxygenase SsuD/methylene tetrahydromethanopterin reductase-like flavin-dependent oxidoreductase (luciferase family)